jgi:hypothetical protein
VSRIRGRWMVVAVAGSIALMTAAGCGGGSSKEEEESVTPTEAIAEIAVIRTMLDQAVEEYREGNAERADEILGDAYLEHFEKVEHPLEEQDEELMEELEVLISTTIRSEIKDGEPVGKIEALVAEAKTELDEAEVLLEAA